MSTETLRDGSTHLRRSGSLKPAKNVRVKCNRIPERRTKDIRTADPVSTELLADQAKKTRIHFVKGSVTFHHIKWSLCVQSKAIKTMPAEQVSFRTSGQSERAVGASP